MTHRPSACRRPFLCRPTSLHGESAENRLGITPLACRLLPRLSSVRNGQRGPEGIVPGKFGSCGGPPGISGLSDDTSVALDGVVNTIFGALIPVPPEQSARSSNAGNPAMLHQAGHFGRSATRAACEGQFNPSVLCSPAGRIVGRNRIGVAIAMR